MAEIKERKRAQSWADILKEEGAEPAQTGVPKEAKTTESAAPLPAVPAAPAAPPKPGEAAPLPAAPAPAAGDEPWVPFDIMKPGALVSKETEEGITDFMRAGVDRFSGGFLPFVGNKLNELTGKGQSPYEAAVNAERRSPTATAAGDVAGTAAQYGPVRALAGAAGAPALVARVLGGLLPAGAETFIKHQFGDEPATPEAGVKDAARGVAAAAPGVASATAAGSVRGVAGALQGVLPFTAGIPGMRTLSRLPGVLPRPVTEGLSALAPGLLEAPFQHEGPAGPGGTERELALERERRRRQEMASSSGR